MDRKRHILVIPTWLPSPRDPITGTYHHTFCRALCAREDLQVNMLYMDAQGLKVAHKYPFLKKSYQMDCEGYQVFAKRILDCSRFSYDAYIRAYTRRLEKLFCQYVATHGKPDVIHAQVILTAGYAAAVIGKKYGIPVVITEHASYFQTFFTGKKEKYARFACENARLTCVGKFMTDILRDRYGYEATVLPNIVDMSTFARVPKIPGDGKTLRLLTVTALRVPKRVDDTIRALHLLRKDGRIGPFRFTVVGDGLMMDHYRQVANELEMLDVVEFVGRKSPQEVSQYLSRADMLIIASTIETFGIPAIEALAAGVPVVCTRCHGPEGFLSEAVAEFCESKNPADLADAIARMAARLPEMDENMLRDTADSFSSESVAAMSVDIYRELTE